MECERCCVAMMDHPETMDGTPYFACLLNPLYFTDYDRVLWFSLDLRPMVFGFSIKNEISIFHLKNSALTLINCFDSENIKVYFLHRIMSQLSFFFFSSYKNRM